MFNSDFARSAVAAIGALVFTITTVAAAAVPAQLAETASVGYSNAAPSVEGGANA